MTSLNRPWVGSLPAQAFQTFALVRPRRVAADFWRKATCEEYCCQYWREGWETRIDLSTELGQRQAAYIVKKSKRSFSQEREGNFITFIFTPGQTCFSADTHQVPNMREPLYLHRLGDHRSWGDRKRQHSRGVDWVEHMQEQLGRVADDRKKG
jgi:hypothetical protein